MFLLPGVYSISGPHSSNISLHRNTLSVLKFLRVRFVWSVYIFNFWPNKTVQNSLFYSRYGFSMGCHAVDLLPFAVKLYGLTTLVFASVAGLFVCVWPLRSIKVWLILHYFSLLYGMTGATQQACFITGRPITQMACIFFLSLPARPFSVLVGKSYSPSFCFLPWMEWTESDLVVVLEGVPPS